MFPFSDADTVGSRRPIVNLSLITICCLTFVYEIVISRLAIIGGGDNLAITVLFLKLGFIPSEITTGQEFTTVRNVFFDLNIKTPFHNYLSPVTSLFLHGGLMHLLGNMMFLWVFGDNIENHMGHFKYLLFYLMAGLVATFSHWFVNPVSEIPLIGASGAVSGVLGAYLLTFPYNRVKVLVIFFLITVVQLRAMWLLGLCFAWQIIQGSFQLGISDQVSVAFFAHIGGFLFGAIVIGLYRLLTGKRIWPDNSSNASLDAKYWRGRPLN